MDADENEKEGAEFDAWELLIKEYESQCEWLEVLRDCLAEIDRLLGRLCQRAHLDPPVQEDLRMCALLGHHVFVDVGEIVEKVRARLAQMRAADE